MSTNTTPRPNRYADDCATCDEWVGPGDGHLHTIDGAYVVTCADCAPPATVTPNPNNRDGACETCGTWVPAGAGAYMSGRGVQCARHAAMSAYDAGRDYEAAMQARSNERRRLGAGFAGFRHILGLAATPAEANDMTAAGRARNAENARIRAERVANAAAHGGVVCTRCGGAGGHTSWPGFTCFDCGGAGWVVA